MSLKGVSLRYGEKQVLREVGLEVRVGEVLALIGPNGAGKSTIAKIIGMAKRRDAGEVWMLGQEAEGWESFSRPGLVGVVA
jgi:ABC-type sugar transport system ATPase subunit